MQARDRLEADADERAADVERVAHQLEHARHAARARRAGGGRPRARPRARRRGATRRRRRRALRGRRRELERTRAAAPRGTRARAARGPDPRTRWRSRCVPSPTPASRSFRYSLAQAARPGSTGASKRDELLRHAAGGGDRHHHHDRRLQQRAPRRGARSPSRAPGAETSASRRVTWLSISVVDWSAASTSLRIEVEVEREAGRARLLPREQLASRRSGSPPRSGCGRPRCAGA